MGRGTGSGGWLGGCRQSWRKAAVPAVRVLCITTVIPAKAGIQRGGARAVHAESHHRDIAPNGCTGYCAQRPSFRRKPESSGRFMTDSPPDDRTDSRSVCAPPRCPTPLDSGFRRNDGLLQSTALWIPDCAGMTDVCKAPPPLDSGLRRNDVLLQSTATLDSGLRGMTDVCKAPTSGLALRRNDGLLQSTPSGFRIAPE